MTDFGPYNGPYALRRRRNRSDDGLCRALRAGLQNRSSRFDSSVPRFKTWLSRAKIGTVEPNPTASLSLRVPLGTAGNRCGWRTSVPTAVPRAIEVCGNCGLEREEREAA